MSHLVTWYTVTGCRKGSAERLTATVSATGRRDGKDLNGRYPWLYKGMDVSTFKYVEVDAPVSGEACEWSACPSAAAGAGGDPDADPDADPAAATLRAVCTEIRSMAERVFAAAQRHDNHYHTWKTDSVGLCDRVYRGPGSLPAVAREMCQVAEAALAALATGGDPTPLVERLKLLAATGSFVAGTEDRDVGHADLARIPVIIPGLDAL